MSRKNYIDQRVEETRRIISSQYLKIKMERQEYLGDRYFKWSHDSDTVIQVCLHPGEVKRGRTNNIGILAISKISLASNYMAIGYVEPCTKREFDKSFQRVVQLLQ